MQTDGTIYSTTAVRLTVALCVKAVMVVKASTGPSTLTSTGSTSRTVTPAPIVRSILLRTMSFSKYVMASWDWRIVLMAPSTTAPSTPALIPTRMRDTTLLPRSPTSAAQRAPVARATKQTARIAKPLPTESNVSCAAANSPLMAAWQVKGEIVLRLD